MNFKFNHNNLNVRDLEKSIQFYKDALGLTVVRLPVWQAILQPVRMKDLQEK